VIATHGIFKKSKKTPKQEIIKAEEIRKYFIENVNGEK
jgi:phage-related protein